MVRDASTSLSLSLSLSLSWLPFAYENKYNKVTHILRILT